MMGMQEPVTSFIGAFGPGAGTGLGNASSPIFFPQIRFFTNDAWPVIRGISDNNAFPILLMNQYGKGKLFVLTIPANFTDLYEMPEPALNAIRSYVMGDFPVRIEAPAKVSLFAYDNGSFIIESFRDEPAAVTVLVSEGSGLANVVTGERLTEVTAAQRQQDSKARHVSAFKVEVQPHTYMVFTTRR
jgi:hypothetical protein